VIIDNVNSEYLVDTPAEIADPTAMDRLRGAFHWEPPWDEFASLRERRSGRWRRSARRRQCP
jgi:hypothetical protein